MGKKKRSQPLLSAVLPFELTNGNTGRGHSFKASARKRKRYEEELIYLGMCREPFLVPVSVHVTRVLGKRQACWDSSSIGRGNWKEIEDALVAVGVFHDDSPKWIVETRFFQDDSQRENGPAVKFEVFPLEVEQ